MLLVPLWLCRINDTAGWDELNWSKCYCHQNQATVTPSPKCWGFLLSGEKRLWPEPWCRGIWNPWLLLQICSEVFTDLFHNAMCVFSVVPGLVSRAVDVQSCSSENECSFGGGWKWLTGGMRISFNKNKSTLSHWPTEALIFMQRHWHVVPLPGCQGEESSELWMWQHRLQTRSGIGFLEGLHIWGTAD